jgi:hypothetical protein
MTDFFSDLERQLVDATPRRPQRLRRARRQRLALLSTILLLVVAGGAGLATAISGSDAGTSAGGGPVAPATTAAQTIPAPSGATPRRGAYTVAVLNGTTVPGLARAVANRLQNDKYKIGNVTNGPDQPRTKTTVTFTPGHADRALRVAKLLGLAPAVVSPASARERALAGQTATVIVTVGADQNTAPIP